MDTRNRCIPTLWMKPWRYPTDFSARIARNTQLFLQQETDTCNVVDPWGGSYFVERLTHDLALRPGSAFAKSKSWAV